MCTSTVRVSPGETNPHTAPAARRGDDPAGVANQVLEQVELALGQLELDAVDVDLAGGR